MRERVCDSDLCSIGLGSREISHWFSPNIAGPYANLEGGGREGKWGEVCTGGRLVSLTLPSSESGTAKMLFFCFEFSGPFSFCDDCACACVHYR